MRPPASLRGRNGNRLAAPAPHPFPPSQQEEPMIVWEIPGVWVRVPNTCWENATADFRGLALASHEAKTGGRHSEAVLLACALVERYPSSPLSGHILFTVAASALTEAPGVEDDGGFMVQRLRRALWFLYQANERLPLPGSDEVSVAAANWYGMTNEQRSGFLSVNFEKLKEFFYRRNDVFVPWPVRVLSDAVSFAKANGSWVYWSCPTCKRIFISEESFAAHVESEHLLHMPTELKLLVHERAPYENSELNLDPDASCLSLDPKKFVRTYADGSFLEQQLFEWLFGMLLSGGWLVPWTQVKGENHRERTHVLEELNLLIELLGICRLKHELSKCVLAHYRENLLEEVGPLDSEQLILKIRCLKKKLAEASRMDFSVAVVPMIKLYLWAKLMGDDTERVSQVMTMSNTKKLSELKMKIECLKRALPDRSKVPKDHPRVFWGVIVRSLWHLRRFREKILVTIAGSRHFRDVEGPCVLCMLYKVFDAWDKEEDDEIALLLPDMEIALKNTLRSSSMFRKIDGSSACEVVSTIFEILHMSQTSCFNYTGATFDVQATEPSRRVGNTCIVHNLFGIFNDHCAQYSSFFHILQGKSFIDLSKVMDQLFVGDVGSDIGSLKTNHFFTAVVIWLDGNIDNFTAISKILVSMASTFDIDLMFESNQRSDGQYALVSMVCQCNQSHLMFARCGDESKKWLVYNGKTCEEPGELVELLARHADRNIRPEVLFLERVGTK